MTPEKTKLWNTVVVPTAQPTGDAKETQQLEQWLAHHLKRATDTVGGKPEGGARETAHYVQAVLPILAMAVNEIVRLVTTKSTKLGGLLDRTWRSFSSLFDMVCQRSSIIRAAPRSPRMP